MAAGCDDPPSQLRYGSHLNAIVSQEYLSFLAYVFFIAPLTSLGGVVRELIIIVALMRSSSDRVAATMGHL